MKKTPEKKNLPKLTEYVVVVADTTRIVRARSAREARASVRRSVWSVGEAQSVLNYAQQWAFEESRNPAARQAVRDAQEELSTAQRRRQEEFEVEQRYLNALPPISSET
jgi:hypothetical protein